MSNRHDAFTHNQPLPRVYQYEGKRYALRLERVFIETLQALARTRKIRTGALVHSLARGFRGKNLSSFIRTYCMIEVRRMLLRADPTQIDLYLLIKNTPCPSLLFNENEMILTVNSAMKQWLGDQTEPAAGQSLEDVLEPRIQRPLQETITLLQKGKLKSTQFPVLNRGRTAIATLTPAGTIGHRFTGVLHLNVGQRYSL